MTFKPMLATDLKPSQASQINYPVIVQPKIDGFRLIKKDGKVFSRSGKPFKNVKVKTIAEYLPDNVDCEVTNGFPNEENIFNKTQSLNGINTGGDNIHITMFDVLTNLPNEDRARCVANAEFISLPPTGRIGASLPQTVSTAENLKIMYLSYLEEGYEGIIIRNPAGRYKQGRSTLKEQLLLRIKPKQFHVTQAVSMEEEVDIHGSPKGRLGAINCVFILNNNGISSSYASFSIGTGFDADARNSLWHPLSRQEIAGKKIKFTCMEVTKNGIPRHPVFHSFGDKWTEDEKLALAWETE